MHFGGRPVGNLAPEVECHHLIGDAQHKTHVMLDQQDGDAEPVADADYQLAEFAECPMVEAGLCNETAHQVDERVPIADLATLTAIYRRFIDGYFAPR